jgi:uncharacterized protein YbjT (DUF2867 family)
VIVIMGASGRVGGGAAAALLAEGEHVRILGRSPEHVRSLIDQGAEFVATDLFNPLSLTEALTGASAAFVMIPESLCNQVRVADLLASAIERSRVTHVVCLSTVGADRHHGTGPINDLRRLERNIGSIRPINALFLRPAYFMENHFAQIPSIKKVGIMVGLLKPEVLIPQIATRDVGAYVAEALHRRTFTGKSTRELLGQRDLSMQEVSTIIGKAIGKPKLHYSQVPANLMERSMLSTGMPRKLVRLTIEMFESINSGWFVPEETRSAENTTATSFETFVRERFAPVYLRAELTQRQAAAPLS